MQDPGSKIQGDFKRKEFFKNLASCIMHPASVCLLAVTIAITLFAQATSHNAEEVMVKASAKGDSVQVRQLLDKGTSVNSRHKLTGWSAITAASYHGQLEIVRILIQAGADVNARDKTGGTPLLKAVTVPDAENISELLEVKAEIVRELLKAGANPQLRDRFGGTAWEQTITNNHQELIDAFKEVKGVKETQLIDAAIAGDMSTAKKMIEEGADVNLQRQ